jgi:hypothetical protein
VKKDIIKQFNCAASSSHGISITSVNPVIKVDNEGNKKYEKHKIKASNFSTYSIGLTIFCFAYTSAATK